MTALTRDDHHERRAPQGSPTLAGVSEQPADATPPDAALPPGVNVSVLLAELMSRTGVIWVQTPDGRTHPVWHVWDGEQAFVVSGPGEQQLPWLPREVRVILRSKDSGGRLLTTRAFATVLEPGSPVWQGAVEKLAPERLNGDAGQVERWLEECTVTALHPFGLPVERPGELNDTDRRQATAPSPATSRAHRPWHWRGRGAKSRQGDDAPQSPTNRG